MAAAGDGKEANVAVMLNGHDRHDRYERTIPLRASQLRGVELTTSTWQGVMTTPKLLSQLSLMLCDAGGGEIGSGRQQHRLSAGDLLVRAPQQVSVVMQHV